ncbi:hypothetical protein Snoj_15330 [Streptomyces nojiriensis]|uniref:Carrier domain-containing protein n=1 Tax=Streptomyces nojiriensis TaxID=66374 RepID=A0ABQ3SHK8_9ACTN|nr:acyl carrier protein [Streptomyces nojiriensis]QTI49242.1 hypothetical protein JYK04_07113 [Streptomyces nojiriensis]GGS10348.1 hypothetical protein GCM10010205_44690 [Streptomyces nojiriensis]GHI67615.1 hypothetical protein Snoj_15330 [Streptomyces nojiriensis]
MPNHHAPEPEAQTLGRLRTVVTEEWIEALGLPRSVQPPGDEDFFEISGNSMQAIVMLARIGARLGLEPSVETLYLNGTLDALVEHCQAVAEEQRAADGTRAPGPGRR